MPDPAVNGTAGAPRATPADLLRLFLKLGLTAFGGPAAHIAMMQDEVVQRRRWLDNQRFLDLVGAANLIPGPTSTELAIHIGWQQCRWTGLWLAGLAFIVPAVLLTLLLAWVYVEYRTLPAVAGVLHGMQPVILAIVVQAIWRLMPAALRTARLAALAVAVLVGALCGVHELVLLGAAAVLAIAMQNRTAALCLVPGLPGAAGIAAAIAPTTAGLFLVFAKIGSVLFGSGYVLLAFLRSELVVRLGWLSEAQLIDAVAVGQITPGPVFTAATFAGYLVHGTPGALAATAGIFLPAFLFVAISAPFVARLRASPTAGALLDGVNAASLALMAAVTVQLGRGVLRDWQSIAIAVITAVLLLRWRTNATWLLLLGGACGWLLS